MSVITVSSLLIANQQVFIYMGIPILTLGVIGGVLNTSVFLSLRTFRENSCAFYLTIMSILNIGQLLTGLLTRIFISGFSIDFTRTSLIYCKCRTFFLQVTTFSSFGCICLAAIDQYFATCTFIPWQRWRNLRLARCLVLSTIIIAIIAQIPTLIYYGEVMSTLSNKTTCTITSNTFYHYNLYGNYLLLGNVIPYTITFTAGILAYRNIRQLGYRTVPLVRRELDKQLSTIVLVQISYIFLTVPASLVIYFIIIYGNIQDVTLRSEIDLAYTITVCLYYSYFASPFYIYMLFSERFRRQCIYVICQIFTKQWRQHRIAPNPPSIPA
ncbi:unnamed protein product [Adineta ricciae]|uniref:G-protein coupled receptors family 1 profile domain-containing protein n=1 Tax=Adineta ricciae TaxID=249248 RepID=A0A815FGF7_ADIRI|nr:unnamed protein product [Adineta ricciae]CAF1565366.1 unnamed protein product [Adineta ricciae]